MTTTTTTTTSSTSTRSLVNLPQFGTLKNVGPMPTRKVNVNRLRLP
jgi:hypothetical protein